MHKIATAFVCFFCLSALSGTALGQASNTENGIVRIQSQHDVTSTTDRLEALLKNKGMTVFSRINHAKGAESVGIKLSPAQLLIFGNPKIGSGLMQCNLEAALDLPQKVLVWKDGDNRVWLSYNNPDYLSQRHQLQKCGKVLNKVAGALKKLTAKAARRD